MSPDNSSNPKLEDRPILGSDFAVGCNSSLYNYTAFTVLIELTKT
jgi:hypothetical protein